MKKQGGCSYRYGNCDVFAGDFSGRKTSDGFDTF